MLDQINRRILRELQESPTISNAELAAQVGLSPSTCLARLRRLHEAGFITGCSALLNPDLLGFPLLVFTEVCLRRDVPWDGFTSAVQRLQEIQECHRVAGHFDYLLKVRARSLADYRAFICEHLLVLPCVQRTLTRVVVEDLAVAGKLQLT